jgi:hypothetical protein
VPGRRGLEVSKWVRTHSGFLARQLLGNFAPSARRLTQEESLFMHTLNAKTGLSLGSHCALRAPNPFLHIGNLFYTHLMRRGTQ